MEQLKSLKNNGACFIKKEIMPLMVKPLLLILNS